MTDWTIRAARDDDGAAWDAFVDQHPSATFFHCWGWREVIARAFKHRTHYLVAEQTGRIVGILPLVRVRSRLFGDSLTSLPFAVYGGPVGLSDDIEQGLVTHACDLADECRVDALEIRYQDETNTGWPRKDLYVTFTKAIADNDDENLKAIPRKQRAMVRKGIKAGLQARIDNDVDGFFDVYAESVRNLGTPVFPRRYFHILKEVFGSRCDILHVRHEGQDVAAVMSFWFRDQVLPYYGGSRIQARSVAGNDFMYWALMQEAVVRGVRMFDFGRSKQGTGAFSFKKNWGFEPKPLAYEYYLVKTDRMPDVNPNNPKYRLFIDAWKRLPVPVANIIGPRLSPYLG